MNLRRDAARVADRVAAELDRPPQQREVSVAPDSPRWWDQSLSRGAPGVALLHSERATDGVGSWDTVDEWLRRATTDGLSATSGCGLWFGAPAVAFALQAGASQRYRSAAPVLRDTVERLAARRTALAMERIDAAQRPARSEYDLVRGLTGLGAYLLLLDPARPVLHALLRYLVRLTEPLPVDDAAGLAVPGWWTCEPPSRAPDPAFAFGQSDQGMAHGRRAARAKPQVARSRSKSHKATHPWFPAAGLRPNPTPLGNQGECGGGGGDLLTARPRAGRQGSTRAARSHHISISQAKGAHRQHPGSPSCATRYASGSILPSRNIKYCGAPNKIHDRSPVFLE